MVQIPVRRPYLLPITKGLTSGPSGNISDTNTWNKAFFDGFTSSINAGNNASLNITDGLTISIWANLKESGTTYGISSSLGNIRSFVDKTGTNASFTNAASYAIFDTTSVNANSKGFRGSVFDGHYMYFVPGNNGSPFGQITRYDTTLSFTNAASYAVFDTTTVSASSKGFFGGVFDGRYIYLIPFNNGSPFGQITRYDTTLSFTNAASYAVFDTTTVNVNSKGFVGGVFDGRYIYLVPNNNGVRFGQITRYDTTLSFTNAASYSVFDTTTVNANSKGFLGGVFDGRYIYLVPDNNGSPFGQITRYDTTASFTNAASYSVFDTTTVNANSKGFLGGAFDGRYIYLVPANNGVPFGQITIYDATSTNISYSMFHGLGQNSFGSTPFSPGLRINTNNGVFSVWTNRLEISGLHHITGVYDSANSLLKIYVDGVLINSTTATGIITTDTNNLTIGSILNSFNPTEICEISIISQTLDVDQINGLMTGQFIPTQFTCKLWHDYRLGHSYDVSGNSNNGINTGVLFKK